MNLPNNHAERIERARLSLEGLAIGDAFGEMLAYNCAGARQRVERGLMAGPWFHTDVTADGDCDTNCAMVGGIVVLYAGLDSIPADWRPARELFDFEEPHVSAANNLE